MKIRAVAFDLDGTLYRNAAMYLRSVPFFFRHPRLIRHFGHVRRRIRSTRPITDFHEKQAELLGRSLHISPERARLLIDTLIYERWERVLMRVPTYDGVPETLVAFRSAGLKVAVLSDFPVERKLSFLGLQGLFDCAFSSEETGYLKPNPEPFLELAERLDLPPREIMYVGNNYKYDILGAKEVGMRAAYLTRRRIADSKADVTFSSYAQLRKAIFGDIPASEKLGDLQ
jgi:putative hydrolase of the HAD superfamily